MDFREANDMLGNRNRKKVANNTYLERISESEIGVKLHATYVVIFTPNFAILDTGGWYTVTTKERISRFSPVDVSSVKGRWYVSRYSVETGRGELCPYFDGIKIDYSGNVLNPPDPAIEAEKEAQAKATKKEIARYVKAFGKALEAGEVPFPSGGDCWYCAFVSENGKTMGDLSGTEHLREHMREDYFVPSLALNAVKERGYVNPGLILGMFPDETYLKPFAADAVKRALSRYLKKRLVTDETL